MSEVSNEFSEADRDWYLSIKADLSDRAKSFTSERHQLAMDRAIEKSAELVAAVFKNLACAEWEECSSPDDPDCLANLPEYERRQEDLRFNKIMIAALTSCTEVWVAIDKRETDAFAALSAATIKH